MAAVAALSTSQVAEADLRAIATCQTIFHDQYSACHGLEGHGTPLVFPSLADSSVVRAEDSATLV